MIVKVFWLMDLAFTRHGQTSIGLRLNFEGLRQKAGAVVSTNRIADLDNLLRREEPRVAGPPDMNGRSQVPVSAGLSVVDRSDLPRVRRERYCCGDWRSTFVRST